MSHDFRFSNLLGAPYRGGTLLLHGNTLLSPVGNRVTQARPRAARVALPGSAAAAAAGLRAAPRRSHPAPSCADAPPHATLAG